MSIATITGSVGPSQGRVRAALWPVEDAIDELNHSYAVEVDQHTAANGSYTLQLACTGDLVPAELSYRIVETCPGAGTERVKFIRIPHGTVNGTVDGLAVPDPGLPSGGGAGVRWVKFSFAYNTPGITGAGAVCPDWAPAVGDVVLFSAFDVTTPWNGPGNPEVSWHVGGEAQDAILGEAALYSVSPASAHVRQPVHVIDPCLIAVAGAFAAKAVQGLDQSADASTAGAADLYLLISPAA